MRLCILSSGSSGNCAWVEGGGVRVLVDCGLPLKETARRCAGHGLALRELDAVLLTHEHADHAHAAGIFARKLGVPVYATRGTLRALRDPPPEERQRELRAGHELLLGGLAVIPIALPHDATEPVAYRFEALGTSAAIVTDLGAVTRAVVERLQGLDALVLEFNHDARMLAEGPYPWSLKQRIRGGYGHLSNAQGAELLARVVHPGLRRLVLAHLSEHNNTPAHALRAASQVLARARVTPVVEVASPVEALEPLTVTPAARPQPAPRQLALFA